MKHSANPLILALDVPLAEAKRIVKELKPFVEIFKVGSRLFTEGGPQTVQWVRENGRKVFLDLKFHDIPNTVAEACRNAVRMKVWAFTVHTSGGFAMMKEAVKAVRKESKLCRVSPPLIFGVTVLTSMDREDFKQMGISQPLLSQVQRLASLAKKAGLDGVVASGNEVGAIKKKCGKNFLAVTPGIRMNENGRLGDQKRVMDPSTALTAGSDYLIVGRPVLNSKDRIGAIEKIYREARKK